MDIQKRLQEYLDYKGISKREFEKMLKLGNGTASKLSEKTRESTIDRITAVFVDLNVRWLFCGVGEMLRNDVSPPKGQKNMGEGRDGFIINILADTVKQNSEQLAILKTKDELLDRVISENSTEMTAIKQRQQEFIKEMNRMFDDSRQQLNELKKSLLKQMEESNNEIISRCRTATNVRLVPGEMTGKMGL